MSDVYQLTGEVTDNRHLTLDAPIPFSAGKVRVTVEPLPGQAPLNLNEFMEHMWENQRLRGHTPRTKEEIDRGLIEERDSWKS